MSLMDYDFPGHMAAGKARAIDRRNRGRGSGSHASWHRRRTRCEADPYLERLRRFADIKGGFRDDCRFYLNPDLLEGF